MFAQPASARSGESFRAGTILERLSQSNLHDRSAWNHRVRNHSREAQVTARKLFRVNSARPTSTRRPSARARATAPTIANRLRSAIAPANRLRIPFAGPTPIDPCAGVSDPVACVLPVLTRT